MKATTPPYLGADVFYNTNEELVIYVPMESLEAYKTSGNWSAYADKIQYKFTEGLAYSLNTDGASYSVTGIGTATDTGVVIPSSLYLWPGKSGGLSGDDCFSAAGHD